mgnify:CR=1 FL=1
MKNIFKFLLALAFLASFSLTSNAQIEDVIEINNTNISVPNVYDFGDITEAVYTRYYIKNNRGSAVTVSNITTPAGFFANISDMNIASGKRVILYVGLEPSYVPEKGKFEKEIIIQTNLVTDIIIKLKGNIP